MSEQSDDLKSLQELLAGKTWIANSALWLLLAALRGPDDEDQFLKERTTWRIRSAIAHSFFKVSGFESPRPIVPDKPLDTDTFVVFEGRLKTEIAAEHPYIQPHFLYHYAAACWVLAGKNTEDVT